jgi:hypothetical protein
MADIQDLRADHAVGRSVTVSAGAVELFTYVYAPDTVQLESPKPYLHPIRDLAGELVSTFRPHDHVWHKGIAWSLPNVGEHNFWGGPTYVNGKGYVQLENNGTASHLDITALSAAADRVRLAHRLKWTSQAGDPVIDEERSLSVSLVSADSWVLVFDSAMTNRSGAPLAFGSPTTNGRENAGYGGLFWRGPRSFAGGVVQSPERSGGDELRGTRAEWFAFRGRHDGSGAASTVVIVDDRENLRHPPQFFARTEAFACLNPAPFFSEEYSLPAGETLRLRYAVVVAAGDHGDDGTVTLADHGRNALASVAR